MTTKLEAHTQTADSVPKTDFKVWRTLRLGTGLKTEEDFEKSLKDAGHVICVDRILGGRNVTRIESEVDLVRCSLTELGFDRPTLRRDVITRGEELGLKRCVAEVGPQLRLQYLDQPPGEKLVVAMSDYSDFEGERGVFVVNHEREALILGGTHGSAIGNLILPDWQIVFVKPRD